MHSKLIIFWFVVIAASVDQQGTWCRARTL